MTSESSYFLFNILFYELSYTYVTKKPENSIFFFVINFLTIIGDCNLIFQINNSIQLNLM